MRVLAIETSCDETGIALVEGHTTETGFAFKTHHAVLLSQAQLHAEFGGVFPTLAKREHLKNLPVLFKEFEDARNSIDAIVVTEGPGLEPALWTGIEFAKELSIRWQQPIFGVNHMEGHLISSLIHQEKLEDIKLPVLALLISGGHTEFVLMSDWFNYKIIGQTLDDAVGEAFDKVARMLGLGYPGGPEISKIAQAYRSVEKNSLQVHDSVATESLSPRAVALRSPSENSFRLPRPMLKSNNCDLSFSGLKTAALYALRGKNLDEKEKAAFAAEFEDSVADVFVAKSRKALQETEAKTFVIGGGVAANSYIRQRLEQLVLEEFPDLTFKLPELYITGDNAIMVAEAALAHLLKADWTLADEAKELKATGKLSLQSH